MIILMINTELNQKAADALQKLGGGEIQIYPNIDLSSAEDKEIILVDLEADSEFPTLEPEILADFLIKKGLKNTVGQIHLLVSQASPEDALVPYGFQLRKEFIKLNKTIDVYTAADINSAIVIIDPPEGLAEWKIYSISDLEYKHLALSKGENKEAAKSTSYSFFKNCSKKSTLQVVDIINDWVRLTDKTKAVPTSASLSVAAPLSPSKI